jgi:hypothetical protein
MTDDRLEDDDTELEDLPPERPLANRRTAQTEQSTPSRGVLDLADINRRMAEKERERWEKERQDQQIKDASLSAWEKERLADAEGREARLAPLEKRDPFAGPHPAPVPRLTPKEKTARRYERVADEPDDAEIELAAMIAECRYFMREIVFESARLTPDAGDRLSFIDSARKLAETSALVGRSIAPLRNPALIEPEEPKKRARR